MSGQIYMKNPKCRGLVSEYEALLLGKRNQMSNDHFYLDKSGNPIEGNTANKEIAVGLISYFFNEILGWDIATLEQNLSYELFKNYYLDKYLHNQITFDYEPKGKIKIVKGDMTDSCKKYLIELTHPEIYTADEDEQVIEMYRNIRQGKEAKFPKNFFLNSPKARRNACLCLRIALQSHIQKLTDIDTLYAMFADTNILKALEDWRLRDVSALLYPECPIDYLYDALQGTDYADETLYKHYRDEYIDVRKRSGRKY